MIINIDGKFELVTKDNKGSIIQNLRAGIEEELKYMAGLETRHLNSVFDNWNASQASRELEETLRSVQRKQCVLKAVMTIRALPLTKDRELAQMDMIQELTTVNQLEEDDPKND